MKALLGSRYLKNLLKDLFFNRPSVLQNRFKKLQDEKANLSDSLQELEHNNMQLASETETIGELIFNEFYLQTHSLSM